MKRLLKVTGMTGILTLLRMLVGFVIAKVVAIYTGPTGMAMLGQIQGMVSVLNGLVSSPAGSGVVRYTAENKGSSLEVCAVWWRAAIQWIIILSSIVVPVGLLLSENIANWLFQDPSYSWLVKATVCVLPLSALGVLCNSIINGQEQYRRYVTLGILSVIVSGTIMLIMITQYHIKGALLASAVQSSIIGLVMLIANIRQPWMKVKFWIGNTDNKARQDIARYMLMALTSALTLPISLIVIRGFLVDQVGWDVAGLWQAVWKISEVYLGVITLALSTYYLPRLASLSGVDSIVYEIHKTAKMVLPIVVFLAISVYVARDVIIYILFTEEFIKARELFSIQLTGDVVKIASWLYAYPMLSRGAAKWFISTEIVFSLFLVSLSYAFISYFGIIGAPMAYLTNYIIYFLFVFVNVRRFSK
ncbi:O-antigen translocase [Vibrio cyclitrophicus]|uniref:O-antigen translocase n=1 Tax=Vibrio cyclitrophicus TaxID=47951 RepID=UPI0021C26234|nr:O-antigen translocase [Vibrio cyclitrophicus]